MIQHLLFSKLLKVIRQKNKYQVMLYSVFVQKTLWRFLQIALFRLFKALWNICECVDDKVSSAGLKYTCVGVTLLNFIFYFAHFSSSISTPFIHTWQRDNMSKAKVCRNSFFFVVFRKYYTVEELLDEMSGEWVFIVNQNLENIF